MSDDDLRCFLAGLPPRPRQPAHAALHYTGTGLALILLLLAIIGRDWRFLIAAPVAGYAFAWTGHFATERNKPATFGHPFWSLFSDFRMFALWATRRLAPHLARAGLS